MCERAPALKDYFYRHCRHACLALTVYPSNLVLAVAFLNVAAALPLERRAAAAVPPRRRPGTAAAAAEPPRR